MLVKLDGEVLPEIPDNEVCYDTLMFLQHLDDIRKKIDDNGGLDPETCKALFGYLKVGKQLLAEVSTKVRLQMYADEEAAGKKSYPTEVEAAMNIQEPPPATFINSGSIDAGFINRYVVNNSLEELFMLLTDPNELYKYSESAYGNLCYHLSHVQKQLGPQNPVFIKQLRPADSHDKHLIARGCAQKYRAVLLHDVLGRARAGVKWDDMTTNEQSSLVALAVRIANGGNPEEGVLSLQ